MSMPAELSLNFGPSRREIGFWLLAGVAVLVLHAAFASFVHASLDSPEPVTGDEQALVIDLAPLPISLPEIVETETAPEIAPSQSVPEVNEATVAVPTQSLVAPEPVESVEAEQSDTQLPELAEASAEEPSTVEPTPVEPEETVTSIPEAIQPLEVPLPEIAPLAPIAPMAVETPAEAVVPDAPAAEIVTSMGIAPIPPELVRPEIDEPAPKRQPVERKAEPKPSVKKNSAKPKPRAAPKPEVTKEKASAAAMARASSAQTAQRTRAPVVDSSRWNSAVRAAVARQAGRARGTKGTVSIQFEVSSGGAITSARVSSSSGNARLDGIALSIVRSARVPRPPEGLSGRHSFAIPLTFR